MRTTLLVLFLTVSAVGVGLAATPGFMHMERSDADKADLDRISQNLNAVHTMKGSFVQVGPDGQIDEGVFYIDKPGRMRFEYHAPNPVLIVSDGTTVAVSNRKLNTVDTYPLFSTPLNLILSDTLNLKRNPSIAGLEREPGEIIVNARAASDKVSGNLSMVFGEPNLDLREWTIIDAQGLQTRVSLKDVQTDVTLDPSLFKLPEAKDFTKKDE